MLGSGTAHVTQCFCIHTPRDRPLSERFSVAFDVPRRPGERACPRSESAMPRPPGQSEAGRRLKSVTGICARRSVSGFQGAEGDLAAAGIAADVTPNASATACPSDISIGAIGGLHLQAA